MSIIPSKTLFYINDKKAITYEPMAIMQPENGYFILDMWNQCDEPDLEIFPVKYVECRDECELYQLQQDNVFIGEGKDFCLK